MKIVDGDGTTLLNEVCGSEVPNITLSRTEMVHIMVHLDGSGRDHLNAFMKSCQEQMKRQMKLPVCTLNGRLWEQVNAFFSFQHISQICHNHSPQPVTMKTFATGIGCQFGDQDYAGLATTTASEHTCQTWSSTPRHQGYVDVGHHNYCRNPKNPNGLNPDGRPGGIWCFTSASSQTWEYCSVPQCDSGDL